MHSSYKTLKIHFLSLLVEIHAFVLINQSKSVFLNCFRILRRISRQCKTFSRVQTYFVLAICIEFEVTNLILCNVLYCLKYAN